MLRWKTLYILFCLPVMSVRKRRYQFECQTTYDRERERERKTEREKGEVTEREKGSQEEKENEED